MPQVDLQGTMILLHGPPKVGKTQLASRFPGPVQFMATEPGHRFLPEDQRKKIIQLKPGEGWDKFRRFVKTKSGLRKRKPKTIVMDTIAGLYDLCFRYVCEKKKWEHPSDADFGKGWDAIKKEFYAGMNDFVWAGEELGATVILIDHSKEETLETATENYGRVVCAMPGQCRGIVVPVPDHIWFLGYLQKRSKDALKAFQDNRALYLAGNYKVEAGTRDKNIKVHRIGPLLDTDKVYKQILDTINKKKEA